MEAERPVLFTIGHSTHEWPEFVALLRKHGVTAIADVRSQPASRLPQYKKAALQAGLKEAGINYVFLGRELGARRAEPECYDGDQVSYERIARLPRFLEGLERLRQGSREFRIALMCAEKEPLDCHRTILVCRQLRNGFRIRHILADGSIEEHEQTERRLVRQMDVTRTLFEPNLTEEDLIQQAYEARGRQIAYRADHEGAPEVNDTATGESRPTITVFTIGFTGHSAEEFFEKLQKAGVKTLVDVRLNNVSQLAGFAKKRDLEYFLRVIAGIDYVHEKSLAPTKDILDDYKKKRIDWAEYERRFNSLLEERQPADHLQPDSLDRACLLCSEHEADQCHRRLVTEYLESRWGNVVTKHL